MRLHVWEAQPNEGETEMTASYIPASDAGFAAWLLNFRTQLDLGVGVPPALVGDVTNVDTVDTAYQAAYLAATDPLTRTPVTVAAKNTAKSTALATVRPIAQLINADPSISDGDRVTLGLTVRSTTPTPITAPTTFPLLDILTATPGIHTIQYRDSDTPTTKAKPFGALQMELYEAIGIAAAPDPTTSVFAGLVTKSPFLVPQDPANAGKIATYFARWVTRTGLVGPWSSGVTLTIAF